MAKRNRAITNSARSALSFLTNGYSLHAERAMDMLIAQHAKHTRTPMKKVLMNENSHNLISLILALIQGYDTARHPLPYIDRGVTCKTVVFTASAEVTFTNGSGDIAWIGVSPTVCNDLPCIYYTNDTYTGTSAAFTPVSNTATFSLSAGYDYAYIDTPFASSSFTGTEAGETTSNLVARIVVSHLKVRCDGVRDQVNGRHHIFSEPTHRSLYGFNWADFGNEIGGDSLVTLPGSQAHTITLPVTEAESSFNFDTAATTHLGDGNDINYNDGQTRIALSYPFSAGVSVAPSQTSVDCGCVVQVAAFRSSVPLQYTAVITSVIEFYSEDYARSGSLRNRVAEQQDLMVEFVQATANNLERHPTNTTACMSQAMDLVATSRHTY
jgi:hypothetical protein